MHEMYEYYTTDVEGGLVVNTEDCEDSAMDNGLEREVRTPESNYNHMNASVLFSRGNSYARRKVVRQKIYAYENALGRSNNNPILDKREYSVEFSNREISELTSNVISDSMYAACKEYGNEYLMMDSIVDYWKSANALSVAIQKVTHKCLSFMRRSTVGCQICVQWRYGSTF